MPQLVVTAVLVEGRAKSEVARDYGISRRWVITLVQRYVAEGDTGLPPIDPAEWEEVARARHARADGDTADFSYVTWRRRR